MSVRHRGLRAGLLVRRKEKGEHLQAVTGPCGAEQRAGEAAAVCLPPKDPRRRVWFPATQPSKAWAGPSTGSWSSLNANCSGRVEPVLLAGSHGDVLTAAWWPLFLLAWVALSECC